MKKIEVWAYLCTKCNTYVYSRARHDYRSCPCGNIHVDGGFDYAKIGWEDVALPAPEPKKFMIDQTLGELYDDWSGRKNKFGYIKEEGSFEF